MSQPAEDRMMLEFARRWIPFGQPPPGDILVEFGMTTARFYSNIRRILHSPNSVSFPAHERRHLERLVGTGDLP